MYEYRLLRPDGTEMPVDEAGRPTEIEDVRALAHALLISFRDILNTPIPAVNSMGQMHQLTVGQVVLQSPFAIDALTQVLQVVHDAVCPAAGPGEHVELPATIEDFLDRLEGE